MINIKTVGQGVPLVLFHGWGFDSSIWLPFIQADLKPLACKLYLVDLPGFGKTPNMAWQVFKDELLHILPSEFILLGWSLGGLFATRLCIEAPNRVLKLINVTSSPYFVRTDEWVGIDRQVFMNFYQQFKANPRKTREEFIRNQFKTDLNLDFCLANDIDLQGLERGLDLLLNWDLRQDLYTVEQPVLFLFGKLDAIVPRRLMPVLKKYFPQFNYVMLPKAAHVPFLSHMQEFSDIIREFCQ